MKPHRHVSALALALVAALAAGAIASCKQSPSDTNTSTAPPAATATPDPAATATATASASATPPPSATATATVATATATDSGITTAASGTAPAGKSSKLAVLGSATTSAAVAAAPAAPSTPPVRFQKATPTYKLEASPPDTCKAGAPCEVAVRLEAVGAYHINKDYPYKLKAEPSPGVVFEPGDATFTKAAGHFSQQGESLGIMKVRFTGQQAGQAKIRGVYKFSVCSESDCKLEQADVAFEAPIK